MPPHLSRRWTVVGALVSSVIFLVNATAAWAAPGDLDPTFDQDGKVFTDFTARRDRSVDIAIQPDGKIVVVGAANTGGSDARFAVSRYDENGELDTTFGGDGKVMTNFTSYWDGASAVAVQPDGKIVVAGEAGWRGSVKHPDSKFAVARYDSFGVLDTTFSGDGKVMANLSSREDFALGVAIQPLDGRIVLAGGDGRSGGQIAIARLHPGGALDATFGSYGWVTLNVTAGDERVDDVVIQADGKLVVAGTVDYFSPAARVVVARFTAGGSPDPTFSGDGRTAKNLTPSFDGAFGLAIQPSDGRIVVVGQAGGGDRGKIAVLRFQMNGAPDGTFAGGDGVASTNLTPRLDYADDVAIQADGKIVAVGAVRYYGPDPRFAVVRYSAAGALDTTFSDDGKVTTDFGSDVGGAYGVAIQGTDGKIVVAGAAGASAGRFGIARYLP
jgi:uncharacterized delta-60 repeat protein